MVYQRFCSADGCDGLHYGKGFCRLHYKRAARGIEQKPCKGCGGATPSARAVFCTIACKMRWNRKQGCYTAERTLAARGSCSIDGCSRPVHSRALCNVHQRKNWKYGNPLEVRRGPRIENCVKCGAPRPKTGASKDLCHRCYHNAYYHANVETERPRRNARRGYLIRCTPPWADLERIREIYAGCPQGHQVDHVIPIKGKKVSGLHVETNLQYLPTLENRQKLNKYEVQ